MKSIHYSLDYLIRLINEPYRSQCKRILDDNRELFQTAPGSSHNHQAWPGGYADHIRETMNIAIILYVELGRLRPLSFTLSDALIVLFLHDLEKPWKYETVEGKLRIKPELTAKEAQAEFRNRKLEEYNIVLSYEQAMAMKHVEGEKDHSTGERSMTPLGAFCHMADIASARIWFDYPKVKDDEWDGSSRICKQ